MVETESGIMATAEDHENNEDRINRLPDCVLSSIFSLLPLKDAMDTVRMVSCRWRHLDPILTRVNLEFDIPNVFGIIDPSFDEGEDQDVEDEYVDLIDDFSREEFVRLANAVLQLYRGNKKVDSFKVTFFLDRESTAILDEWVRFSITKAVSVLDLHLYSCMRRRTDNYYVFPCCLLSESNASNLQKLSLTRCVLRPPASFGGFSQITTLYLYRVDFDETFIRRLCFEYCLLLESLTLRNCPLGSEFILHGPSLRLNDLNLVDCDSLENVDISLPKLASFEVADVSQLDITISIQPPHPSRISFHVRKYGELCATLNQFASYPGLETLHLQLRRLWNQPEPLPQSLPTFRHLKKLALDIVSTQADLGTILTILKAAPLLEELILSLCFHEHKLGISDFSGFTHASLRKVKLQGFRCMPYEIDFASCLLKNTKTLEIMVIDPFGKMYFGAGVWWDIFLNFSDLYPSKASWEEKGRALVQEELKKIETNARVLIL